jgi:hypothetical protein
VALDLTNPDTWENSTLATAAGPIRYWVLADWDAYYEQYEDVNNLTRVLIAVGWHDALDFKRYALGFAERLGSSNYFHRHTPLENPFQEKQYLTSLKKTKIHAGTNITNPPPPGNAFAQRAVPSFHIPAALSDNWPTFRDDDTGMAARIVYDATFTCPDFEVLSQTAFEQYATRRESVRFVTRSTQVVPRERKVPSFGFETYDAANLGTMDGPLVVPIPEVGFVPDYYFDHYHTWRKVPLSYVPWTAIGKCINRINNTAFEWSPKGDYLTTYGRWKIGTVLFKGLASRITPYRGPNAEWLVDLPYVFSHYPAVVSGNEIENSWNYIPRNDGTYAPIRVRGTNPPQPLYQKADFEKLYQPEP